MKRMIEEWGDFILACIGEVLIILASPFPATDYRCWVLFTFAFGFIGFAAGRMSK